MNLPLLFNPPFSNAVMTLYAAQLGQPQMPPSHQHEVIARAEIQLRSRPQVFGLRKRSEAGVQLQTVGERERLTTVDRNRRFKTPSLTRDRSS
jgi:hypothetical protein